VPSGAYAEVGNCVPSAADLSRACALAGMGAVVSTATHAPIAANRTLSGLTYGHHPAHDAGLGGGRAPLEADPP